MRMPQVKRCEATECAYNSNSKCHALAITIGDEPANPMCDTFCVSNSKGGDGQTLAGVGACKVSQCQFNTSLECGASEVTVGRKGSEFDCMTFKMR